MHLILLSTGSDSHFLSMCVIPGLTDRMSIGFVALSAQRAQRYLTSNLGSLYQEYLYDVIPVHCRWSHCEQKDHCNHFPPGSVSHGHMLIFLLLLPVDLHEWIVAHESSVSSIEDAPVQFKSLGLSTPDVTTGALIYVDLELYLDLKLVFRIPSALVT